MSEKEDAKMNINIPDFLNVIQFGTSEDFLKKLKIENKSIEDIINTIDKSKVSLLEKTLINRKFDIAKILLEKGANVNVVSNEGCNELHYLAANINCIDAIEIAHKLIERGVDLNLKDKKYGNSALMSLFQEVFKERTQEGIDLLIKCLKLFPELDGTNLFGYSLRQLIIDRGTEEMKKIIGGN